MEDNVIRFTQILKRARSIYKSSHKADPEKAAMIDKVVKNFINTHGSATQTRKVIKHPTPLSCDTSHINETSYDVANKISITTGNMIDSILRGYSTKYDNIEKPNAKSLVRNNIILGGLMLGDNE
jgi:hypothetical protein